MNLKLQQEMTAIKYLGMFGVNQLDTITVTLDLHHTHIYQYQPVN